MIKFDDNLEIEGTIENSIININNEWIKIFILKNKLTIEQLEKLYIKNKEFKTENKAYVNDGYIKSEIKDNITYSWFKLKYSYETKDEEINDLKKQILELQTYVANKEYENLLNKGGVK